MRSTALLLTLATCDGFSVLPLLSVPPVSAAEVADAMQSDAATGRLVYEGGPLQIAALAVTVFSVLPTPGMLGLDKNDVGRTGKKDEEKQFGFSSVDDAVRAARDAIKRDDDST